MAQDTSTLQAQVREKSGKGPAHRLRAKGLVAKQGLVKVLGRGQLTRALQVKAHAFSKSAEQAITSAGGSVEVLPPPFGHGRPPAKGNALTNR